MKQIFTGNFTQQEPLREEAIEAAISVMRHGRLHRYNLSDDEVGETALLEQEFASYIGAKYCVAVASGGYALSAALRAAGAKAGDKVLTNAFTLAPVPGAIANPGCDPVFVEVTDTLVMDLDDLQAKIAQSKAKFLLLSHMRGHLVDMDILMRICNAANVKVIEDCAHTMGASWDGVPSGRHGIAGCYSTQTFKHLNSGEGGLLVTDDAELAARAIMLSGSYMLFERHGAGPAKEVYDQIKFDTPNCSGRMDNLRAAILRPQLRNLDAQCQAWNKLYRRVEDGLCNAPGIRVIERPAKESYVMSSFQFLCPNLSDMQMIEVQKRTANRGVELKWFGADQPKGFTSRHDSWAYLARQSLPKTDRVLAGLFDMRLPLTFSLDDCDLLASIIREEVSVVFQAGCQ